MFLVVTLLDVLDLGFCALVDGMMILNPSYVDMMSFLWFLEYGWVCEGINSIV
jgi:hypothetical protein